MIMKLAVSTLGCPDWSFEKILSSLSEMGIQGVEIRGILDELDFSRIDWFNERAMETLGLCQKYGVKIIGLGTSAMFHEEAKFDDNIREVKACVDICKYMGIGGVRVFGDRLEAGRQQESLERIINGLQLLCSYAEGSPVKINLEVHGGLDSIGVYEDIINNMQNYKNFGIIWDIEHSDRFCGDDFLPFYQLIKPYISHLHVKDYKRASNEIVPVGDGDIPIARIVETLLADGYDGYFSFEWEKRWIPQLAGPETVFPRYVEYMNSL